MTLSRLETSMNRPLLSVTNAETTEKWAQVSVSFSVAPALNRMSHFRRGTSVKYPGKTGSAKKRPLK
jgi:hypothetical protein